MPLKETKTKKYAWGDQAWVVTGSGRCHSVKVKV